jgi:hypothetical protein
VIRDTFFLAYPPNFGLLGNWRLNAKTDAARKAQPLMVATAFIHFVPATFLAQKSSTKNRAKINSHRRLMGA